MEIGDPTWLCADEIKNIDLDWKGGHSPWAYTWEGCNMLATILRSDVATQRAIQIVRGFTAMEKAVRAFYRRVQETILWFDTDNKVLCV